MQRSAPTVRVMELEAQQEEQTCFKGDDGESQCNRESVGTKYVHMDMELCMYVQCRKSTASEVAGIVPRNGRESGSTTRSGGVSDQGNVMADVANERRKRQEVTLQMLSRAWREFSDQRKPAAARAPVNLGNGVWRGFDPAVPSVSCLPLLPRAWPADFQCFFVFARRPH